MASLKEKIKELNNTPDRTAEFEEADIQKNRGMAVLSYISLLVLVPLFARKNSPYARFHCNQGLVFNIASLILTTALRLMTSIPYVGWTMYPVSAAAGIVCTVLMVLGIVNAAKGRVKELPFIGDFRILPPVSNLRPQQE